MKLNDREMPVPQKLVFDWFDILIRDIAAGNATEAAQWADSLCTLFTHPGTTIVMRQGDLDGAERNGAQLLDGLDDLDHGDQP